MKIERWALILVVLPLMTLARSAFAQNIPLPPERPLFDSLGMPQGARPKAGWQGTPRVPDMLVPGEPFTFPDEPPSAPAEEAATKPGEPSACQLRLSAGLATFKPLPPIQGPGECGGTDLVSLQDVILKDRTRVALMPPATLRCGMAEAVSQWIRDDISAAAAALGSPLRMIENYDSYDCRGRNRIVGAKLSEHGKANAIDIRSVKLANGRSVPVTLFSAPLQFRSALRQSACVRFMTVLGPGSDGYHEEHAHVDLAERRGNYRMCQWDLIEKAPPKDVVQGESEPAEDAPASSAPLPRARPSVVRTRGERATSVRDKP